MFLNTSSVEGFPNTYLQAWARGVPVVGSFDPDEIICQRGLGVHFDTVDEAVEAIQHFCSCSAEEMEAIGRRAVEYVRQNHSPEVVMAQFERVLRSLEE